MSRRRKGNRRIAPSTVPPEGKEPGPGLRAGRTATVLVHLLMVLGAAGIVGGFFGGILDDVIMRIAEIFMGVPTFFLLMVVVVALGPGIMNALIAMIFVWWPAYARLARGQVLVVKSLAYVEAARALGIPTWRILTHHVLRNTFAPIVAQMTMDLGYVILAATSLSFLGLGAQRPSPEWGLMVSSGRDYIEYAWWVSTFPGLAIASVVLGFNLFGDALGQMLNREG